MLTNTFIHVEGIGIKTERRLWQQGILTWNDFADKFHQVDLAPHLKEEAYKVVKRSLRSFKIYNLEYISQILPKGEVWRCYQELKDNVAFVDIETDGGWGGEAITLIGVYNGSEYRPFLRDYDLFEAQGELSKYGLVVTYNGKRFDLPLIHNLFKCLPKNYIHIDLMHPLRRLGYKGGLKGIERQLNIKRSKETQHLNGWDAVKLWEEYTRDGREESLDLLIRYNCEDCMNLKPLIEFTYLELRAQVFERYRK